VKDGRHHVLARRYYEVRFFFRDVDGTPW